MQVWNSQCIHTAVLPLFICSDYLSTLEVPGISSLYLLYCIVQMFKSDIILNSYQMVYCLTFAYIVHRLYNL